MYDYRLGYHIMAKPMGALCNIRCDYCFYLEKCSFFSQDENFKMSDPVLENYIRKYIQTQKIPEISFVWQGGEPMLAGIDFYKRVVELQKKYAAGKSIKNSLQTNGILLTEQWCEFLYENNFMVGLSLDGPKHIHDLHRKDKAGNGTFQSVMKGFNLLKKYNIDFNIMACVSKEASYEPLEIYMFFKSIGAKFIQFTPVVERLPDERDLELGLRNSSPPKSKPEDMEKKVTEWSVEPTKFGDFLIEIFDQWVKNDVGDIFVMNFEWALTSWIGLQSTICIFSDECSGCSIIEHNGDIYSCDHFVFPDYKIGNILEDMPNKLMSSKVQREFGKRKKESLTSTCKECEVLFACKGECPRHRFEKDLIGEYGQSYLCKGYKKYFRHIHPYMKAMGQLIENNIPVSKIMTLHKEPIVIVRK